MSDPASGSADQNGDTVWNPSSRSSSSTSKIIINQPRRPVTRNQGLLRTFEPSPSPPPTPRRVRNRSARGTGGKIGRPKKTPDANAAEPADEDVASDTNSPADSSSRSVEEEPDFTPTPSLLLLPPPPPALPRQATPPPSLLLLPAAVPTPPSSPAPGLSLLPASFPTTSGARIMQIEIMKATVPAKLTPPLAGDKKTIVVKKSTGPIMALSKLDKKPSGTCVTLTKKGNEVKPAVPTATTEKISTADSRLATPEGKTPAAVDTKSAKPSRTIVPTAKSSKTASTMKGAQAKVEKIVLPKREKGEATTTGAVAPPVKLKIKREKNSRLPAPPLPPPLAKKKSLASSSAAVGKRTVEKGPLPTGFREERRPSVELLPQPAQLPPPPPPALPTTNPSPTVIIFQQQKFEIITLPAHHTTAGSVESNIRGSLAATPSQSINQSTIVTPTAVVPASRPNLPGISSCPSSSSPSDQPDKLSSSSPTTTASLVDETIDEVSKGNFTRNFDSDSTLTASGKQSGKNYITITGGSSYRDLWVWMTTHKSI